MKTFPLTNTVWSVVMKPLKLTKENEHVYAVEQS